MHYKVLSFVLALGLLGATSLSFAEDTKTEAKPAAKVEAKAEANAPIPLIIATPVTDIIVSIPLILVEQGVVEKIDDKTNTFDIKRKDGTVAVVKVTENTIMENVYLDIFNWETSKGIKDLKVGDKVRARVFPVKDGVENALLVDVYHWS